MGVHVPFDLDEAYGYYVSERWRDHASQAALSAGQLSVYYRIKRLFPRTWLLAARRLFMRWTGLPDFPRWPLDESVVQLLTLYALCLLAAAGQSELEFVWFWPGAFRAALMLTHDVESAEGLRLAVEIADLEEARGFRSSFNIVGDEYPIDDGIVRELRERGFEIGLHGLHHDRSLFSSREEFERQLPQLVEAGRDLGAVGFRSPATHRVVDWLAELPVEYDGTMFHSDPYEPQPGGCCTLWPFRVGELVELPYTLPQDHTLFTLLRHRSAETWLRQVDAIEERFGLVHCLSHPDPGYLGDPAKRRLYAEFLDALAAKTTLWTALPREVAAWWRQREELGAAAPGARLGTMRREGSTARLLPPDAA
jgi:peptidoglycan/xylan/chitin deacetylase (PgdA/CDA1 family)